jgi:hypothetical protein
MMQKVNVSHGMIKMDKMVKGGSEPVFVAQAGFIDGEFVRGAVLMPMERKEKSDEEAKKSDRREKRDLL